MSTLVEAKYQKTINPKEILFAFADALAKKIHSTGSYDIVFNEFLEDWKNGEILMASRDDEVEQFLSTVRTPYPWNAPYQNWAYPLFTSVSGNKSDRYIERSYVSQTTIGSGCTLVNRITLKNTHTFDPTTNHDLQKYLDMLGITDAALRQKLDFIE